MAVPRDPTALDLQPAAAGDAMSKRRQSGEPTNDQEEPLMLLGIPADESAAMAGSQVMLDAGRPFERPKYAAINLDK